MQKLATSTSVIKTEVYTYSTHAEFEAHFAEMQLNGWLGSTIGEEQDTWITSYRKSCIEFEDGLTYHK